MLRKYGAKAEPGPPFDSRDCKSQRVCCTTKGVLGAFPLASTRPPTESTGEPPSRHMGIWSSISKVMHLHEKVKRTRESVYRPRFRSL